MPLAATVHRFWGDSSTARPPGPVEARRWQSSALWFEPRAIDSIKGLEECRLCNWQESPDCDDFFFSRVLGGCKDTFYGVCAYMYAYKYEKYPRPSTFFCGDTCRLLFPLTLITSLTVEYYNTETLKTSQSLRGSKRQQHVQASSISGRSPSSKTS